MNFVYEIKSNIEVGEKLYGIVEGSIYTYDGVYEIVVNEIDYNRKIVVFDIDQPCKQVACDFYEMEHYVFETEDDAREFASNSTQIKCIDECYDCSNAREILL